MNGARWLALNGLLVLVLLVLALPVSAQTLQPTAAPTLAVSADQVNAIARQMYCPICQNIPLDVCPTTACAEWRSLIRIKLSQGWSEEQIKNYFADQYSDRVLAIPRPMGLNLVVYILPPVLFLGGVWLVVRILRRRAKPAVPAAEILPPEQQDEYLKRMEAELKHREEE
jgi:cytochrome c-type biogenesis protein CcmH